MKKLLVLAVVLFFVFICSQAQAKQEQVVSLENGNLVIKEVKEVKRIPGVPKGISAETAYNLIRGEIKEGVVRDERGKKSYSSFSHPLKKRIVFSDRLITYSQGKWAEKTVSRVKEKPDWGATIFIVWIPAISILIVSIENALSGTGTRKLLVFYVSILVGVLVGTLAGALADIFAGVLGVFAGVLVGTLAGALASMFVGVLGVLAGGLVGVLVGTLAGASAGIFAGVLGVFAGGNYEIVVYYFVFLLVIEAVFFIISRIAGAVKKRIPAIIEAG